MSHVSLKLKQLKRKVRHQNELIMALYLWGLFLLNETTIRTYDVYRIFPNIDLWAHFVAGIALAATAFWIADRFDLYHTNWLAFGITAGASLVWELIEITQQFLVVNPPHLYDIFFWDGFFDVILAVVGMITFVLIRTFRE